MLLNGERVEKIIRERFLREKNRMEDERGDNIEKVTLIEVCIEPYRL